MTLSLRTYYFISTKLICTEICFTLVDVQYLVCRDNKDLSAKTNLYYRIIPTAEKTFSHRIIPLNNVCVCVCVRVCVYVCV